MLNRFNSHTKKLNRLLPTKVNPQTLANLDLVNSLENIELPNSKKFNSNTRSNPNPIKVINNKNTINSFHLDILQYSGEIIKIKVDSFDDIGYGHLFIKNIFLDYGTESPNSSNFEVIVYGLQIPGNYDVKQDGNQVIVSLYDNYIDFDNVTIDDIYVIGKLRYLNLDTENVIDLLTEDGNEIIV